MKKRILAIILACALMPGSAAVYASSEVQNPLPDKIYEINGPDVDVTWAGGSLVYLNGALTEDSIANADQALAVIKSAIDLLGGDENTLLLPAANFETPNGTMVYVFREYADGYSVMGSTVKITVGKDGKMTGLFSSLFGAEHDPSIHTIEAEEAEKIVENENSIQSHGDGSEEGRIYTAAPTELVVLPYAQQFDVYEQELLPDKLAWAVYTSNPDETFPYRVHYVSVLGEYLYFLDVQEPGDLSSRAGYDMESLFAPMETGEQTCTITHADNQTESVTVPVMTDRNTGKTYLGDSVRKIAVADCWSMAFEHELILEEPDADGQWDNKTLGAYLNYIKAYDYFQTLGWTGPDNIGTPILILKEFCEYDHTPVDNAAYAGKMDGWQCFLTSSLNTFWDCLDVTMHEYVHGITTTTMVDNLYQNDNGAINEGMSDILGELGESSLSGFTEKLWSIGDKSGVSIREMADPHKSNQPEYVWDSFYAPHTDSASEATDFGGVHVNSSLLNLLASRLVEDASMTPEQAIRYWLTVACLLTPGTDYPQIIDLLRWSLTDCGIPEYRDKLGQYLAEMRFEETELPDTLESDQVLVELTLPDNGVFDDPNWLLLVIGLPESESAGFFDGLFASDPEDPADSEIDDVSQLMEESSLMSEYMSWPESTDENKIRMVQQKDMSSFYILLNMTLKEKSFLDIDVHAACLYKRGRWVKLSNDLFEGLQSSEGELEIDPGQMLSLVWKMLGSSMPTPETDHLVLSSNGLEKIRLDDDRNWLMSLIPGT